MKIGFDVDGVLARFEDNFARLLIETTGRNLLPPAFHVDGPPTWDWDLDAGYSKDESRATWKALGDSGTFWAMLPPLPGAEELNAMLSVLDRHDVYYITSRFGQQCKWQTETWLQLHVGAHLPTVLISSAKGMSAKALKLDVYVDDRPENITDVALVSPETRAYLFDRTYNRSYELPPGVTRIRTLTELFEHERKNL